MNDESSFDPATFLDATTTEALTRRPPLPIGDYLGIITDAVSRAWTSQKPDAKVKSGIAVDFKIDIELGSYPAAHKTCGVDKVIVNGGVMLDLNESGSIDWGKGRNGALRRWREALDMNKPGEAFSIRQMVGRPILVKIKHRSYQGELYEEVDSVSKA